MISIHNISFFTNYLYLELVINNQLTIDQLHFKSNPDDSIYCERLDKSFTSAESLSAYITNHTQELINA